MEGNDLLAWAFELDRLLTAEEMHKLPFLLDCFKTTEIEYDHKLGIQNIFSGLKQVKWDEEKKKYIVLKAIW